MPTLEVTVGYTELLGYAEDEGIATWNEACKIIKCLYPEDGEGFNNIEVDEFIDYADLQPEDKLCKILVGFAKKHEAEYKTYSEGFKLVVE